MIQLKSFTILLLLLCPLLVTSEGFCSHLVGDEEESEKGSSKKNQNKGTGAEEFDKTPLLLGIEKEIKLNHYITKVPHKEKAEDIEEEIKNKPYIVKQIGLISKTLKVVNIAILQERETEKKKGSSESGGLEMHTQDEEGNIKNGLFNIKNGFFVVFESLRRSHRYHACLYYLDETPKTTAKEPISINDDEDSPSDRRDDEKGEVSDGYHELTFSENAQEAMSLRKLFHTPRELSVTLDTCLLTRSTPNKLFIACEEQDQRCHGRFYDFFGNIYAQFEDDPMAMIALSIEKASRLF
jgi:hypothetical protein